MLQIDPQFLEAVNAATSATALHDLLRQAIRLEHATIPPYLTAAYSLQFGTNETIRASIVNIATEEMLHMAIVTNVLNAIGGSPEIDRADFVPTYPGVLPMNIGSSVEVGLKRFSKALVHDTFMKIEEPENPLEFPTAALTDELLPSFATIGAFYLAVIEKIEELGDAIFTGDPARQVIAGAHFPAHQLFAITNAETATRALNQIIKEGEGTSSLPFDDENELAHYYRFAAIYHGRELVADSSSPKGYSYTGTEIPFEPTQIWNIPDNPKISDYPDGSVERDKVEAFSRAYSNMLRILQRAFDGAPAQIGAARAAMHQLLNFADSLFITTDPNSGKQLCPTFEYIAA
jgi:rubrerythrin